MLDTVHTFSNDNELKAEDLRKRLDYSFVDYAFVEHCLENTRLLHRETSDTSTLLFFAMVAMGRFTKCMPAIVDFTNLYKELGCDECAHIVETCSYRPEDLSFFWSSSEDFSNLFEYSAIQPIKTFSSSKVKRPVSNTIMADQWPEYTFYEVDKVPSVINPRGWGLYDLADTTIVYDTAVFVVLDDTGRPVIDLCSQNYQHVYFTDSFRKHMMMDDTSEAVDIDSALMIQDLIRQPNFCHWVLDHIPRLRHLEDSHKIIMYKLAPFMKNMLELMGIDSNRVHELNERSILKIGRLTIESSMAKNFYHPCQDMNEDLVDFVKTSLTKTSAKPLTNVCGKNVYLSRNKFDRRRISNEPELLNVLAKYDFLTVYPEELSMPEQIELFRNAKVIVSPHGASLTNIVFSDNITLVEIFNQNYGTPTFYIMSKLLGFEYQHILATNPMLSESEKERVGGLAQLQCEDMEVDIAKIEECLSVVFKDHLAD